MNTALRDELLARGSAPYSGGTFVLFIDQVLSVSGRGTVVTGYIESGVIRLQEEVEIIGIREGKTRTIVTHIEKNREVTNEGRAGESVALSLQGVQKDDVSRGQMVVKSGTLSAFKKFEADIYIFSEEEGGWNTSFFDGYRPYFFLGSTSIAGAITLPKDNLVVMPGDCLSGFVVELLVPVGMYVGLKFGIAADGYSVGVGRVSRVIE